MKKSGATMLQGVFLFCGLLRRVRKPRVSGELDMQPTCSPQSSIHLIGDALRSLVIRTNNRHDDIEGRTCWEGVLTYYFNDDLNA